MALVGWKRWAAIAATFLAVFPLLLLGVAYWVVHNRDNVDVSGAALIRPLLAVGVVGVLLAARVAWIRRRRIELDEGGVRIRGLGTHRYLPFSSIVDARVRRSLGGAMLDITTAAGTTESFALPPDAHATLETLLKRLCPRSTLPSVVARLARAGRSFDDWLASLRELALRAAEAGYREAAVDHDALLEALRDPTAPPDVRAGAAFLAATSSSADDARALRAAIDADPPPLVLVAAALGAREASLVEPERLETALTYLDAGDRAAAAALLRGAKPQRARVAPASADVREPEAEREAEAELDAEAPAPRPAARAD